MTDEAAGSAMAAGFDLDNLPAWRFAIQFYERTGVCESLLLLQDRFGLDVTLFLFLLYLAHAQGATPTSLVVTGLDVFIAGWRTEVVIPLRIIRRSMKRSGETFQHPASRALRQHVALVELKAEQVMTALCHQWIEEHAPVPAAPSPQQKHSVVAELARCLIRVTEPQTAGLEMCEATDTIQAAFLLFGT